MISVHPNIWELADYYCERFGSAEERFDLLHAINESFTSIAPPIKYFRKLSCITSEWCLEESGDFCGVILQISKVRANIFF